VPRPGL